MGSEVVRHKGTTRLLILVLLLWSAWTGAAGRSRTLAGFGVAQASPPQLVRSCEGGGAAPKQVAPTDGLANGQPPADGRPNWGLIAVTFLVLYPLMVLLRLVLGPLIKHDTGVSGGSWGPDGADPEAGDDGADPP